MRTFTNIYTYIYLYSQAAVHHLPYHVKLHAFTFIVTSKLLSCSTPSTLFVQFAARTKNRNTATPSEHTIYSARSSKHLPHCLFNARYEYEWQHNNIIRAERQCTVRDFLNIYPAVCSRLGTNEWKHNHIIRADNAQCKIFQISTPLFVQGLARMNGNTTTSSEQTMHSARFSKHLPPLFVQG